MKQFRKVIAILLLISLQADVVAHFGRGTQALLPWWIITTFSLQTPTAWQTKAYRLITEGPFDLYYAYAGTTFYVAATGGSDARSCATATNIATPKLTITNALGCLTGGAGDILYIRGNGAKYSESFKIGDHPIPGSSSYSNGPKIQGYPGDPRPTIRGGPAGSGYIIHARADLANSHWITFKDLILDAEHDTARLDGSPMNVGGHVRLDNVEIKNSQHGPTSGGTGNTVGLGVDGDDVEILNSQIHDHWGCNEDGEVVVGCGGYAIYAVGQRMIIDNSDFYNNGAYALQIFTSGGNSVNDNIVRNSRIWGNNMRLRQPYQVVMGAGTGNKIYNTIIRDPARSPTGGLQMDYRCLNCLAANLVIYGHSGAATASTNINGAMSVEYVNNILMNNGSAYSGWFNGGPTTAPNSDPGISFHHSLCFNSGTCDGTGSKNGQNPLFVNASAADFRLQTGSPAAGAGISLASIFCCDANNANRGSGAWDMGPLVAGVPTSAPLVTINVPTTAATWATTSTPITVSGTASPGTGATIKSITQANDRGGSATCSGTTIWTCTAIPLVAGGINTITITATDSNGGIATGVIRIAYAVPGLIASYGFGEGTGSTVADLSGNGHTGTLVGAVTWGSGKYANQGVVLAGGHIAIPALSSAVAPVGQVTVSLTAKENSIFTDFRALLVSNYSFYLYGTTSGFCGPGGILAGGDGTTTAGACNATPLPAGTNVDLAATYDGVNWKLYRDGALVATQPTTGMMTTPTGNIQIGCSVFGECSNVTISEVRIYKHALTAGEIATDRATRLIPGTPLTPPTLLKLSSSTTALKCGASVNCLRTSP